GKYRVRKATLKPLYQRVKRLQSLLHNSTITYVPRQQNIEADNLANTALNKQREF
ncbi:MAG: reverse transcriptase-like protein, partial [Dehalococcoidia bacterium]|nr:reverse transcriptase-like protein [Dehalococcoidia bacterium]